MRKILVIMVTIVGILLLTGCPAAIDPKKDIDVTFMSAVQTGGTSETANSTGLILTFSVDPTSLTTENITITGATKGALTGSGTSRTLAISDITVDNGATVAVDLSSPDGYALSGSPQTAVVYKATTIETTPLTFISAAQVGGISGTVNTTALTLTFSADPTTLASENITLTGATKGALSGSGTTRSLAISDITVADGESVSVEITSPSGFTLSGSPQTAVVYKDTSTPTTEVIFQSAEQTGGASGTAESTGLILTFSVDPTSLAASDITVTGATKGTLSGSGTTRSLAISDITVADGETVSVAIASPSGFSLSGSPKTAVVFRNTTPTEVTFLSAVQTGGTSGAAASTGLTLTFSVDPTSLAASDITVTGATKGTLSGSGTTRSLAISDITVANGDTVSVAIASPSGFTISGSPKTAVVYRYLHDFSSISYRAIVSITGGTYIQTSNTISFTHTVSDFSIGKYEVTYELWYTVLQWAKTNGYTFENAGTEGNDGTAGAAPTAAKYEPVAYINWRDAIVWCNAYSEMSGLTPTYTYSSATIKDSSITNWTALNNVTCNWSANGYRLPSEGEWQFAASNKGATPWNYASGGTGAYTGGLSTDYSNFSPVAWYGNSATSPKGNATSTKPVGTTTNSNALTIWDMSGNVHEWCWDFWIDSYPGYSTDYRGPSAGSERVYKGGSWSDDTAALRLGNHIHKAPTIVNDMIGFRVAKSD